MRRRTLLILLMDVVVLLTAAIIITYVCNRQVENAAKGKLYAETESIPFNKTGLLLGTAKEVSGGSVNLYYQYRIDAAVSLYKAGKIKFVIISGDNGRKDYNEPELMRQDLMKAGVDSSHIYLDYAGFRTFDSIIRLKKIFGQQSVTIISQKFHNERAIYIAGREDIKAVGFNARDVNNNGSKKVMFREKLARVKVFADYLFGKKPKYLGEKVDIP